MINTDIIKEKFSMFWGFNTALNKHVCLASCMFLFVFAEICIVFTRLNPNNLLLKKLLV